MNDKYTVGRIEQLTLAHKSARPKPSNPAWVNTHRDLGVALKEIERLSSENRRLRTLLFGWNENVEELTPEQFNEWVTECIDDKWLMNEFVTDSEGQK